VSSLPKVRRVALVLGGSLLLLATAPWAFAQAKAQTKAKASPPPNATAPATSPPLATRKWTGDLDGMIKRRVIRVLVAYNKTHYFIDKGTQRGASYDAMKKFEDELNLKRKTGNLRVNVVFIPVSREELLPALVDGRGDIAAASLTVTPEREKLVDFTHPAVTDVSEIVVTGPRSPTITTLDDLAGQEVFVRTSSSYHESLLKLNERFRAEGKKPVVLKPAPETLEDEDLLEMLNAGLVKAVVVDDFMAEFWKQMLPDLTLHPEVALRTGGQIAPAIRKGSPQLKAELDAFMKKNALKTAFGNMMFQRYLKSTKFVKSATSEADLKRFRDLVQLFRTYADKYGVDWLLMAAQGYQESRLDQSVKSPVGAIGVMQVMPATGKDMKVGDIAQLEANVHAGIKYMRFVVDQYYKDEPMDPVNKMLFAFASYNAGPGRVRQLRATAKQRGLDPNVWFNNVERVASEKIGRETVTYVSNIYKYYVAYKLTVEEMEERAKAKTTS
jgi:membrane-bound lytic murein transglycosylase MltF